ncbi:MAG: hypothetical protein Q8Q20_04725 [bacterium]|nr:hypothetical protein [bacterium]
MNERGPESPRPEGPKKLVETVMGNEEVKLAFDEYVAEHDLDISDNKVHDDAARRFVLESEMITPAITGARVAEIRSGMKEWGRRVFDFEITEEIAADTRILLDKIESGVREVGEIEEQDPKEQALALRSMSDALQRALQAGDRKTSLELITLMRGLLDRVDAQRER